MTNVLIPREKFAEIVYAAEIDTEDRNPVRPDYMGRSMYGDTCLALDITLGELIRLAMTAQRMYAELDLDDETHSDLCRMFDHVREDSMGHGSVFYFPGFALTDE